MGYERPFPTYLALGGVFPINSNEGQRTPMVIVDHEPGDRKSGLLKASLHAAVRQASYTHQPSAVAELKYGSRLTLFAEGSGGDLYRKEGGISPKKPVQKIRTRLTAGGVRGRLHWQKWALDNTTDRCTFSWYAVQYEDKGGTGVEHCEGLQERISHSIPCDPARASGVLVCERPHDAGLAGWRASAAAGTGRLSRGCRNSAKPVRNCSWVSYGLCSLHGRPVFFN